MNIDMKDILKMVEGNPLFEGIAVADLGKLLSCMEGVTREYPKNSWIWLAGNKIQTVGIVFAGTVQVFREDVSGKRNLMAELEAGELFGEVFACAGVEISPVSVFAASDCRVLHLQYQKIISVCPAVCEFHQRLVENMLRLLAGKNLRLNQKIEILSKRTIRERLLSFFEQQGTEEFHISLNREELAAYLCVERSALSAELSKMQREGFIWYKGNHFRLIVGSF